MQPEHLMFLIKIHQKNIGRQLKERVTCYLQGTQDLDIQYTNEGNDTMVGYCDADWGNDKADRKSITGYVFSFQGSAIS